MPSTQLVDRVEHVRRRHDGEERAPQPATALTTATRGACRRTLSSEIVENWRTRSRSPGQAGGERLRSAGRAARCANQTVPDRLTVLLVGPGDAGGGDADVGAEHPLRADGHLDRALLAHDVLGR